MISMMKFVILLLSVLNVYAESEEFYQPQRRNYFNYGTLDDQTLSYPYEVVKNRVPYSINWRGPFRPQSNVKETQQASSNSNKENKNQLKRDMSPNNKFLFPDTAIQQLSMRFEMVPTCNGKTYCEEVPDYPTKLVDDIIKNNKALRNYNKVDVLDDIGPRADTGITESLCISNEQVVYPKTAESKSKQWLYIINNSNFTQGIHTETCMQQGKSCKLIEGFAAGYITTCEQKYTYRPLTAIAEDGTVSQDLFRFPSSCCCSVEFVGTSTRIKSDVFIIPRKSRNSMDIK